jgi:hypothetical protein
MTNVTRGLFRLWIVGAVLWAIGVGGIAWWTYPKPNVVSEAELVKAWLDNPDESGKAVTDPNVLARIANSLRGSTWGSKDRVVSNEEFQDAQTKNRREAGSFAAFVGIVPPIVVLIIGASLVWAVRGFRSHPPSAS